jgi:hypothetical protein
MQPAGTVSMSYHRGSSVLQITLCPLRTSIQRFWMPCVTDAVRAWSYGGSPGADKSTYLSYLVDTLKGGNIPVIRHHYFLSLTDGSGDRFSHQVVAESLMQQIQARYLEALGALEAHNPQPEQCGEWLASCGHYYLSQNVPFVVIIDGLDHAWRERRSIEELTLLFETLLPPPENVVVIVGTQRVSQKLLQKSSRSQ